MNPKTYAEILDGVAARHVPVDFDVRPQVIAHLERKSLMKTLRARPVLMLVLVVLALLMLSGVAYAVGNLLGYIPGLGLVERGAPIRVLATPVSLTRGGITLTVENAILGPDKTVLSYRLDNVAQSTLLSGYYNPACPGGNETLRLPQGSTLAITSGETNGSENLVDYGPVPPGIEQAVFMLPCIPDVPPDGVPIDWEVPLRFMPAPPEMTVVPVTELATATARPVTVLPGPTATPGPASVVIEKALRIDNKLVFVGGFLPQAPAGTQVQAAGSLKITDSSGKEIPYDQPTMDLELPSYSDPNDLAWSAEITDQGLSYPLTFTFDGDYISPPDAQATAQFTFDADHDLKPGQDWQVNQDFVIAGYPVRLVSISTNGHGGSGFPYAFLLKCDPRISSLGVDIPGYTPIGFGGGGGGSDMSGTFNVVLNYEHPLKGQITVLFSHLMAISGHDTWQGQWSPGK